MCLFLTQQKSIFLGVLSTQHALLPASIRWYNVDVWSVKRSLVLSPEWWRGTVVLSPLQKHGMLIPLPAVSACLRRSWWKHRATLSSLRTSIRRATCQTVRAEESHPKGEGRVKQVKQSLSLSAAVWMTAVSTVVDGSFKTWQIIKHYNFSVLKLFQWSQRTEPPFYFVSNLTLWVTLLITLFSWSILVPF